MISGSCTGTVIELDEDSGERIDDMPGGEDEDKTSLAFALPIPDGIGSLAHDSGIKANPGRFFTAAWIGLTADNIQDTQRKSGPPEDRAFVFRQPILQTKVEKSKDQIQFKVFSVRFCILGRSWCPPSPPFTPVPPRPPPSPWPPKHHRCHQTTAGCR